MTLYLVRHGRAVAGVEDLDPGLDPLGHKQAFLAAQALRETGATRIVVSPLRRTRETAEPIATALGLEPEIRDEVSEVFDPRMEKAERRNLLGPLLGGMWSAQTETLRVWRRRVIETLLSFAEHRVIVVSHFVAISAAIGEATGVDRVTPGPLANASISRFEIESNRLVLVTANDVSHLADEDVTLHAPIAGRR